MRAATQRPQQEHGARAAGLHSFVVPAYGRSPHLERCVASLTSQHVPSRVVLATSTPFDGIADFCAAHGAELFIHGPSRGIGPDWNAALTAAATPLVTIAHQDDVYRPAFTRTVLDLYAAHPDAALYVCGAGEIAENGLPRPPSLNQRVKELLVALAFRGRSRVEGGLARRLLLGLGNPIVCPSTTINLAVAPDFRFREDLRTNMDWFAWLELSARAPIVRTPCTLMDHRVHLESETAKCLDDGSRATEDAMVFEALWPRPVAKLISRIYRASYPGYL